MTLKVKTTRFGELEIEEEKVICMPDGMIGFKEQRYIILTPEKEGPFCWFQAVDNPEVAFVVVDPTVFIADYEVKLTREEYDRLKLEQGHEVIFLTVATMNADPKKITINLQGPVVLNPERMLAKQIVLEDREVSTKHLLFPSEKGASQQPPKVAKEKRKAMRKVASVYEAPNCTQASV